MSERESANSFSFFRMMSPLIGSFKRRAAFCLVVCMLGIMCGYPQRAGSQESLDLNTAPPAPSPPTAAEDIPIKKDAIDDKEIAKRLRDIYRHSPGLSGIRLDINAGVVRLAGHAPSKDAREQALQLAKRMEGVISVKDEILLQRDIGQRLTALQEKLWSQVNAFIAFLPLLLIALIVFFLFWLLAKFATRWHAFYTKLTPNPFLQSLLKQTMRGLILFVGFVAMLEILDATALLGTILGVAGILGIAVGFAIRDTVENYIASILLSIRQPFRPRDHIVIEQHEGLVMKLTTRDTILMTLDGNHVRVPNATVYKSIILNYTRNPKRRFVFEVGIDAAVNIADAQQLAITTLSQSPGVLDDPPAQCMVERLGDSNVLLTMLGWTNQNFFDFGKVKSEAIRAVKEAFDRANYEMPEPIYRVKTQVQVPGGEGQGSPTDGAHEESRLIPDMPSSGSSDVAKDDHIVKQISQEKEDSREINLLMGQESSKNRTS